MFVAFSRYTLVLFTFVVALVFVIVLTFVCLLLFVYLKVWFCWLVFDVSDYNPLYAFVGGVQSRSLCKV